VKGSQHQNRAALAVLVPADLWFKARSISCKILGVDSFVKSAAVQM